MILVFYAKGGCVMRNIRLLFTLMTFLTCLSVSANSIGVEKNNSSIIALKYRVIQMSPDHSLTSSSGRIFVFPKLSFSNGSHLYYDVANKTVKSGVEIFAVKLNLGTSSRWVPVSTSAKNNLVSSRGRQPCRILSDKSHPVTLSLNAHIGKDRQLHVSCTAKRSTENSMSF